MNHVLMTAFHYPPVKGSSGVHRTLAFSRYLPEYGFKPIILTVRENTFSSIDNSLMKYIPEDIVVARAKTFDTARDFALNGYYPLFLALPDRWQSWVFFAVCKGLQLIRQYRPKVLWSTYPIATAHLTALLLHKATKIPWVADFRDPMAQSAYPENKWTWHSYNWIERLTVKNAKACVFTTPGAKEMYLSRYGHRFSDRFTIIENGIDDSLFSTFSKPATNRKKDTSKPYTFIHSGILYQEERNPEHFFKAVHNLKQNKAINADKLNIILRASGNETAYRKTINRLQISDIVTLAEPVSYTDALSEMMAADSLLLFQGASCNYQIPAKLYEYLWTGIPIIGLVDGKGDTCQALKAAGHSYTADLDDSEQIEHCLMTVIADLNGQGIPEKNS